MAAFSVGQIVRPVRGWQRRDGTLQDWKGYRSAQGWVEVDEGVVLSNSASYFDPETGAHTSSTAEQCYTLWIWDIDSASFVEVPGYPESFLTAASLGGIAITSHFFDPSDGSDPQSSNLCRSRE